jgi:PII-like signaling protein
MSKIQPRDEVKGSSGGEGDTGKTPQEIDLKVESATVEQPKTITMTEAELRKLIKETQLEAKEDTLASVEPQLGVGEWQDKGEEDTQNKTARMRLYQEDSESELGLVVNLKFFKNVREETIDGVQVVQYYKMTVLYEDGEKVHDITLLDFSRVANYEIVEIIETEEKPIRRVLGKVLKTPKKDGYSMSGHVGGGDVKTFAGGEWVDQEENKLKVTHTIKRPSGQTLKLDNSKLNL